MRIALDLDGVAYPFETVARQMLAEHRGVYVGPSQHWGWIEENVSPEDWRWLWNESIELGLFRHGAPCAGAQKGVERLHRLGHVAVVSKRPRSAAADTFFWLGRYLPDVTEVHILSDVKKSVIPADVYIDDSREVVADLRDNTSAVVVVFDRTWNRDVPTDERVVRAQDWEQVVQIVGGLRDGLGG